MSFLIRINRPEHPLILLRESRDAQRQLEAYAAAFLRIFATEYRSLEHARAVVRQLIDVRPSTQGRESQIAWCFKSEILKYEPWVDPETLKPDATLTPENWAERTITRGKISILTNRFQTLETFPFELIKQGSQK